MSGLWLAGSKAVTTACSLWPSGSIRRTDECVPEVKIRKLWAFIHEKYGFHVHENCFIFYLKCFFWAVWRNGKRLITNKSCMSPFAWMTLSDQQMWTLPNVWTCRLQGVPAFCHVSGRSTCELCLSACRIVPRVWRSVSTFSLLMIIWSFVEMFHTKRLESSVTVAPTLQELNDYMDICKCRKVSGCTA